MTLAGKTAFVAGASRGIGATVAASLAAAGASVAVAARSEQRGKLPGTIGEVAARINGAGGRALAVACDVTSEESVNAAVDATVHEFGGIDILVANAGVRHHGHGSAVRGTHPLTCDLCTPTRGERGRACTNS